MMREEGIGFTEDNRIKKMVLEFHGEALTSGHDSMPVLFLAVPLYCVQNNEGEGVVVTDPQTGRNILPLFTSREGALQEVRKLDDKFTESNICVLPSTIEYLTLLRHACENGIQGVCINGETRIIFLFNLLRTLEEFFPELRARAKAEGGFNFGEAVSRYLALWRRHVEGVG